MVSTVRSSVNQSLVELKPLGSELIVADGLCPQIAQLLSSAQQEVEGLRHCAAPLAAITEALAERRLQGQPVQTLHLVAHGRAGAFQIGGQWITATSLIANAAQLSEWQVGHIALWSCEVGCDQGFVALLEELTGASVWTSRDRLGRIGQSSNWQLSHPTSQLAPSAPWAAQSLQEWPYQLASYTFSTAYKVTNEAGKEQNLHTFDPLVPLGSVAINDGTGGQKFSGNDVSASALLINGITYYVWISRPIKIQGSVVGFYCWTDVDFTSLALAQADGNADADGSTADNTGFVLVVAGKENEFKSGTIGSSSDRVDTALNSLLPAPAAAPVATADTNIAQEIGCKITGIDPIGNVLNNDAAQAGTRVTTIGIGNNLPTQSVAAGSTSAVSATQVIGVYGTLSIGADGSYAYTVANADSTVAALPSGTSVNDVFTYTMVDGSGRTSTTTLTITVGGANDDPLARADFNTAKESQLANTNTKQYTSTDPLGSKATGNVLNNDSDVDAGDLLNIKTVAITGGATGFVGATASPNSVTVLSFSALNSSVKLGYYVMEGVGKSPLQDASGKQLYVAGIDTVNNTFTLSGAIAQSGGSAYTLAANTTLGFAKNEDGTSNYKTSTVTSSSSLTATEIAGLTGVTGTVAVGMTVTGAGVTSDTKILEVKYNTSGDVTIIVVDKPVQPLSTPLAFTATSGVTAAESTIVNGAYGVLELFVGGSYVYTPYANNPSLGSGDQGIDQFTYTVQDQLGCTSSAVLTINVLGTTTLISAQDPNAVEDFGGPAIEAGGPFLNATPGTTAAGNVLTNDNANGGTNTVTGAASSGASALTAIPTTGSSVKINGLYGYLLIDMNGGYSYVINQVDPTVQALNDGDTLKDVFRYEISNGLGQPDLTTLTIQINGTNDAPRGLDDNTIAFASGGSPSAPIAGFNPSGNVLRNDSDFDNAGFTVKSFRTGSSEGSGNSGSLGSALKGTYGTFTLDNQGNWTYTVDQANVAVNALKPGESLVDSFNYTVADGTAEDIAVLNVKINGAAGFVDINNLYVNEASEYAVFTVTGQVGVSVSLALGNNGPAADPQADLTGPSADVLNSLECYDEGIAKWVPYTSPTLTAIQPSGQLLVRVKIKQDQLREGNESFSLTAITSDGNATTGFCTINDEGFGDIYLATNTTGIANKPADSGYPSFLDDDRALTVTSPTINEGSDYAVLEVSGAPGQLAFLALRDASGDGGVDAPLNKADLRQNGTLPKLQYFDGANWLDYDPQNPPAVLASGKLLVRVDISAEDEKALDGPETFLLDVTNTGRKTVTGTGTIKDDGIGTTWSFTGNNVPGTPLTNNGPAAALGLDDDRALTVTSPIVNEVSKYAVFEVSGASGQLVLLALRDASGDGGVDAPLNKADLRQGGTLPKLQYFDGANWLDYDPQNPPAVLASGKLLVRVDISAEDEKALDGPETFLLDVTNTGGTTVTGTGTIKDDGTGTKWSFTGNNDPGTPDTNNGPAAALGLDDDRALTVTSTTINEVSQYAVFEVSGASGQLAFLALRDASGDDVNGGVDASLNKADLRQGGTLPKLQYFDGANWQDYDPLKPPAILATGKLLVRVDISAEDEKALDGPENFLLDVTNAGGTTVTGTGTIKDDGTGTKWSFTGINDSGTPDTNNGPAAALGFDDDRTLTVTSPTINEVSKYAVFEVSGASGQLVLLALRDASGDDVNGGVDAPLNKADLRQGGTLPKLQYFDGVNWQDYDPLKPPAILLSGKLLVRVDISAEQDLGFDGPENFLLDVTNTGGTTVTGTGTIKDDGTGTKWAFTGSNDSGTSSQGPGPGFDDDRVPDKVNLRPQTNSGEINDRTTANGKPQIQIIGPSGHKDSYTINGPKGTLLHPSQYTIREVELPQEVGAVNKSVYIIDLIDADRTKPGSQPFGRYFQGRDTGNTPNGGDGTYRILYNGANFADNDVAIRTNALSAPARAKCLTAIYGNAGDRSLESTLFGYRTDKPKGTAGDDNLSGTRKTSDSLTGLNGSDLLNGMGDRLVATLFNPADDVGTQVDRLTGGGGRDFFQLADAVGVYYVQNGDSDQAIITDFAKDDCLILKKGFGYQLQGTGTTRQLVALGAGPGGVDDRIATITGAPSALNGLNTALGGAPSSFVSFL